MHETSWIENVDVDDKDTLIDLAKLAEHGERFTDMACAMKKFIDTVKELGSEERNLFSVAYKNVVASRRSSWRVISNIEKRAEGNKKKQVEEFRKVVEKELENICNEVLDILNNLILNENTSEGFVFYQKMKGDYYRYLAESQTDTKREEAVKLSKEAYEIAFNKALSDLTSIHPIRLGLALNFSVFYYEIENDPDKACAFAKTAFEDAISQLHNTDSESTKESTLVMQLLRDNLTLWSFEHEVNP